MNCNTHWNLAPSPNQAGCPHCLTLPLLVQPCGACASRDIVIKELRADLIAERSAHKEKRMLEAELAEAQKRIEEKHIKIKQALVETENYGGAGKRKIATELLKEALNI